MNEEEKTQAEAFAEEVMKRKAEREDQLKAAAPLEYGGFNVLGLLGSDLLVKIADAKAGKTP